MPTPILDKKWVIVANRVQAKIFEYDQLTTQLSCINTFQNTAGRQHSRQFGQDRLGARRGKFTGKNSAQDGGKDPHELAAVKFAMQLADGIAKAFAEKKFLRATVFAEPHFLGLLRHNMSPKLSEHLEWIAKDLGKATTDELEKQISL